MPMRYQTVVQAEFIERPNRFVAYVKLGGRQERVHVKNTGRCRELLTRGARVWLSRSGNPSRATAYDLVAVEKDGRVVNIDSQAPNKAAGEWLSAGALFPGPVLVRPEKTYGRSRFDFYVETEEEKIFVEVKGVTLEEGGVARFPDAPSERAVKHVEELIRARGDGYRVCVLFVVQMEGIRYVLPNWDTHRAFAEALGRAKAAGVEILACDCRVKPDGMEIRARVPVYMTEEEAALQKTEWNSPSERDKEKLRMGDLSGLPEPLLKWYDGNRRILPWREQPTPYRVWVSEIMLQQTRVEAVKPYFERFMNSLPDIAALAEAQEENLLKLWEGLGYYNRVRNLQKAAVQIMERYEGEMPCEYEELIKLPGIGSYTAGAISSIAYGKPNPAVDGNVLRVISRIRMDDRLISDAKVKTAVERDLRQIMPADRPGDFNQAMMEIGACVCLPNGAPRCGECPLAGLCRASAAGTWAEYPKKAAAKQRGIEEKTVLVIRDAGRTAIRRRSGRGLLAGMYEFPSLEGFRTAEEVVQYLAYNGMKTIRIEPLEEAKHIFTHKEWHMRGYMVRVDELEPAGAGEDIADWIYIEPEETRERYPIPAAFGAYTKMLRIRLGKENFESEY